MVSVSVCYLSSGAVVDETKTGAHLYVFGGALQNGDYACELLRYDLKGNEQLLHTFFALKIICTGTGVKFESVAVTGEKPEGISIFSLLSSPTITMCRATRSPSRLHGIVEFCSEMYGCCCDVQRDPGEDLSLWLFGNL